MFCVLIFTNLVCRSSCGSHDICLVFKIYPENRGKNIEIDMVVNCISSFCFQAYVKIAQAVSSRAVSCHISDSDVFFLNCITCTNENKSIFLCGLDNII